MTADDVPVGDILALDVGAVRVGVARASGLVRLAEPLMTIVNDEAVWLKLAELCQAHGAATVVVGLPRGLDGQETAQTAAAQAFAAKLADKLAVEVVLQDEAVTSRQAEAELAARGKPYVKGDIDALAATYILDDYLEASHGKI